MYRPNQWLDLRKKCFSFGQGKGAISSNKPEPLCKASFRIKIWPEVGGKYNYSDTIALYEIDSPQSLYISNIGISI